MDGSQKEEVNFLNLLQKEGVPRKRGVPSERGGGPTLEETMIGEIRKSFKKASNKVFVGCIRNNTFAKSVRT